MAEPPPAPPSKRGPASKLEKSVAAGSNLRSQSKAVPDRDLEKSKKKINRKLAMDAEIDQKKAIGEEKIDQEKAIGEEKMSAASESELDPKPHEPQQIHSENNAMDQSVSQMPAENDQAENQTEMEEMLNKETNPEPIGNMKAVDKKEEELVDLKPALEMIAEMSGLKSKMRSDEYEEMSEEILNFARMIANEQSGDKNKKETLRNGISAIAERFVKESKLCQGENSRESGQDHLDDNGESGSSSWQEEFSTEVLEEMKGLCEVYAQAKGGLKSKEETDEVILRVIRELKINGLRDLKGKMKQDENEETMQPKGVTFAPSMENHVENAGMNSGTLKSEKEAATGEGTSHVCENAPKSKTAQLNAKVQEMTPKKAGVDPEFKGGPSGAPPGNQKLGKQLGETAAAPVWGKNVNVTGGNNGGSASQGWGNKQGAQSRNASKNRKGDQTPQKTQAPNLQGRGINGGQQGNWNNGNNTTKKNDTQGQRYGMGTPGRQAGVIPGNVRGEGNLRHQNQERGWGYGRGGGRGFNGRGGRGWNGGISHEAVKKYEREGAEICRGENIDPGGEKIEEKREEGECEMKDEESEEGRLEKKKAIEKEIKASLFKAHVSPIYVCRWADDCPKSMDMRLNGRFVCLMFAGGSEVVLFTDFYRQLMVDGLKHAIGISERMSCRGYMRWGVPEAADRHWIWMDMRLGSSLFKQVQYAAGDLAVKDDMRFGLRIACFRRNGHEAGSPSKRIWQQQMMKLDEQLLALNCGQSEE
nr:hypothetical protein Itr_chr11CG25400 [Ipomoea trifida]